LLYSCYCLCLCYTQPLVSSSFDLQYMLFA
jgi:hypothetical protein